MMEKTPRELGYFMPAEWEKHSAVWLAWPYDDITFSKRIEKVEKIFIEVIKAIRESELVNLLIRDENMKKRVEDLLHDTSNITFHLKDYADVWTRDYAPTFLKNNSNGKARVKWNYNAYGGKFPDLLKDNDVFNENNTFEPNIVMEGGAIETNGKGTILTTEQCLLNPNRNPNLKKKEIENYLKDYLGANNIIWLKEGIINDHTDGHIDDVAKFVNEDTIVCGYEENSNDPNFEILKNANDVLNKTGFKVIKLPMPHMNYDDGVKAPASYVNFYIGNGVILVPVFNDSNDDRALDLIQSIFPEKKILGIDCTDIIYGGGAIHCITHEEFL